MQPTPLQLNAPTPNFSRALSPIPFISFTVQSNPVLGLTSQSSVNVVHAAEVDLEVPS